MNGALKCFLDFEAWVHTGAGYKVCIPSHMQYLLTIRFELQALMNEVLTVALQAVRMKKSAVGMTLRHMYLSSAYKQQVMRVRGGARGKPPTNFSTAQR